MARDKGGESGTLAILSSSKEMAFLPTTLHRLNGSSGHLPSQESPKPSMECLRVKEGSGKEDHKDDEEDDEDEEDFDHEPPIGGD